MELLTLEECAALLKVRPRTVYEMTSKRGQERTPHPLPVLRLNAKCLRFRREDIEKWLDNLSREQMS
jgi:predicted DNA-binding transcriptional regulator AlpA